MSPSCPSTKASGIAGSESPRFTEARTLTDVCGASRVDSSDIILIDDDFDLPVEADDPVERYPDGEFEEEEDEEGCSD